MKVLYGKKWFRPREIAKLGLIKNSVGSDNEDSNRKYILKLIKSGKLLAKDYSATGAQPYWLVSQEEIDRYHKTVDNLIQL